MEVLGYTVSIPQWSSTATQHCEIINRSSFHLPYSNKATFFQTSLSDHCWSSSIDFPVEIVMLSPKQFLWEPLLVSSTNNTKLCCDFLVTVTVFNPVRDVDARFILASVMLMPQMLEMVTTQN